MARVPVETRRRKLVDAAFRIITTEGIRSATTRRVAEEADMTPALVHYCFTSIDDLYLEVFRELAAQIVGFTHVTGITGDLADRVEQYVQLVPEWARENPQRAHAMYETTVWATRRTTGARTMADAVYALHADGICRALAGRPYDAQSELGALARVVMAAVDGLMLQWVASGDDERYRLDSDRTARMLRAQLASAVTVSV